MLLRPLPLLLLLLLPCLFSPAHAFALDVFIDTRVIRGGNVTIRCRTNLPDATKMVVVLRNDELDYVRRSDAVVQDGVFQGVFESRDEPLAPGMYTSEITIIPALLQPDSVQGTIGSSGEELTGPLAVRGMLGRGIFYSFRFGIL